MRTDTELAGKLRDMALLWLQIHQSMCESSSCIEPLGFLAFLAHCMGMKTDQVPEFHRYLEENEANCANCPHHRN